MTTLTLGELYWSARHMDLAPEVLNTGGGVRALGLTIDGEAFLLALDEGRDHGTDWTISTDGTTRDNYGEAESTYPVTSDADQTLMDAIGWARIAINPNSFAMDDDLRQLAHPAWEV